MLVGGALYAGNENLLIEAGIDAPIAVEVAPTATDTARPAPALQFQRIVEFIRERRA